MQNIKQFSKEKYTTQNWFQTSDSHPVPAADPVEKGYLPTQSRIALTAQLLI